jgi:hypothetical protein
MTEEKQAILNKVNALIDKRKDELLKKLPIVHEVSDAIIIRFFTKWDNCDSNEEIKYKLIKDKDNPDQIIIFYYIPKGAHIILKKRDYIRTITCLNGFLELDVNGKLIYVSELEKVTIDFDEWQGRALENTYAVTSN